MPATTPPKGRPTVGKIDRELEARRIRRRNQLVKAFWIVLAILIVVAIFWFGSNTGDGGGTHTPGI